MTPYTKPYKSARELVRQLKQRGLIINDDDRAMRYLQHIGYYRLSAYMYPFLSEPKSNHQFKEGVTFDNILRIYRFDKKLRMLLFNEIEKIEIAFRYAIVNTVTCKTGDVFWMTNPCYVNTGTVSLIDKEYRKSTEDFIEHFKQTYSNPYPPAWIISEILPFGSITWIYKNLSDSNKKAVAKQFYLHAPVLESWINIVALTRNSCGHHARVWNKVNAITSNDMQNMTRPWITALPDKRRIYYNICIIKYFLDVISPNNDFFDKIIELTKKFPEIDLRAMGFTPNWKNEPLWKHNKRNWISKLLRRYKQ